MPLQRIGERANVVHRVPGKVTGFSKSSGHEPSIKHKLVSTNFVISPSTYGLIKIRSWHLKRLLEMKRLKVSWRRRQWHRVVREQIPTKMVLAGQWATSSHLSLVRCQIVIRRRGIRRRRPTWFIGVVHGLKIDCEMTKLLDLNSKRDKSWTENWEI